MTKLRFALLLLLIVTGMSTSFAADKMKPEDLLAKHLDAIGSPEARKAAARGLRGRVTTHYIVGGTGSLAGDGQLLSRGRDIRVVMDFHYADYTGEDFLCSGDKVNVGFVRPGVRSQLGQFLYQRPEVLKEGLFGGVLSTAWPLLDPTREAKLQSDGQKNVDGKKLLEFRYSPKHGGSDDQILLFFDPETFRHVMTRYTVVIPNYGSGNIGRPAGGSIPLVVEERFSDFAETTGAMLPRTWNIRYTQQGGVMEEWQFNFSAATNSIGDDAFLLTNPAK
jgi:hypothetical protein